MAHIYIAFVDTPGIFSVLFRKFLKQRYIHVVISGDAMLEDAYSVGRRNPAIPFSACRYPARRELRRQCTELFLKLFFRQIALWLLCALPEESVSIWLWQLVLQYGELCIYKKSELLCKNTFEFSIRKVYTKKERVA